MVKHKSQLKKSANLAQDPLGSLAFICNDFDQWPQSWAGEDKDVVVGNALLTEFKRYLLQLINKGRAKATIKKHADYLWALGGEIIRDTSEYGVDENVSSRDLILKYVDDSGGPYWRHASSETDLKQYDSVCRQLYKFLIGT
jgi:hypothetical protein